eukprot:CAMPEP_0204267852 /NCGR_PEP_ID=MMETSP0468-20130131/11222_1 /ASSEMBLY_ACC=CAM_ASM_000383 /TAXON_ID=2969 /ORGANISM="Oxyrrhis marina" /LENGTH=31 /DNA_ID= /DNA_START= /DNA_END= /DNA_ORIENTATION=
MAEKNGNRQDRGPGGPIGVDANDRQVAAATW